MKENIFNCLRSYLDHRHENAINLAQRARTSKNTLYRALNGQNISFFAAQRLLNCAGYSIKIVPLSDLRPDLWPPESATSCQVADKESA